MESNVRVTLDGSLVASQNVLSNCANCRPALELRLVIEVSVLSFLISDKAVEVNEDVTNQARRTVTVS